MGATVGLSARIFNASMMKAVSYAGAAEAVPVSDFREDGRRTQSETSA